MAAHRAALREGWQAGYAPGPANPSEVVTTVRSASPAGTVMTTDVGSHKIMAGQAWTAFAPRETLITNGLSAMGFGLPAAIGAAVSGPGPVVCLAGDGGFGMTATELAVAARLGLGLVVVVFSDGSLNRIELHQAAMGYPLTATAVDRVDIPVLAESLGCDGVRVENVSGLEKALFTAFSGRVRRWSSRRASTRCSTPRSTSGTKLAVREPVYRNRRAVQRGPVHLVQRADRAGALAANYPFATIEPNVGVVGVPDPRLGALAGLYNSARIVPASVRFTDIAGLVRGASQGQGLGNQFLGHIRETDAICQVVRVFADPDVTRVEGSATRKVTSRRS